MNKNKLIEKLIIAAAVVFLPFLVYRVWFFSLGIITSGDWGFFFRATQQDYFSWPWAWKSAGLGGVSIALSSYFINLGWGVLSYIANFQFSERIMALWPSVIFASLGSYLLAKYIFKKNISAVVSSLIFTFNTYFLVLNTGHFTVMAAGALAPLIFYFFLRTLAERSFRLAILTGLSGFICAAYDFRIFYIIAFVLFFYSVYYAAGQRWSKREWLGFGGLVALPFVLIFLLNVFWIWGLAETGGIFNNEIFNRRLFGNSYMSLIKALTLLHPFWTGAQPESFVVQPTPFYFFWLPLAAVGGLLLNRKRRIVIFCGFIGLLGIFLTKQVGLPFPEVYPWLFNNFPGFGAFREASKFYLLIALSYSILIAALVDWWWSHWTAGKIKLFSKYLFTALVLVLSLGNIKPIVADEMGKTFAARQMPADYGIFQKFISAQPEFFRIFWTPISSRWSFYQSDKPKINNNEIIVKEWRAFLDDKLSFESIPTKNQIMAPFHLKFAETLFAGAGIKYVVVPIQDKGNDDDFFVSYGGRDNQNIRQWYIGELDKLDWLERLDIGTKDLVVYENKNHQDHFYAGRDLTYVGAPKTDFDQSAAVEKLYLNSGLAPALFDKFAKVVLPVTYSEWQIGVFQQALLDCADKLCADKIQRESDEYQRGQYFAQYQLNVPVGGQYAVYLKNDWPANLADIKITVNQSPVMAAGVKARFVSGYNYFGTIDLIPGWQNLQLRVDGQPVKFLAPDILIFVKDNKPPQPASSPLIEYRKVNPTKYVVSIANALVSFPLIFSENYHPDWRLLISSSLAFPLPDLVQPAEKIEHFQVNNFENGWWLDLPELERQGLIRKNGAGFYDFSLTIEFTPQKYYSLGFVITLITLGFLLGCLVWPFIAQKFKIRYNLIKK
jgi:hypothetical protein